MARRRDFARGAAAIRTSRLTSWFQFQPIEVTLATNAVDTLAFTLNAAALALRPFTIVRTHFQLTLRSDQAAAIELQTMAIGMAVVSDEATAVGITAIPSASINAASNLWFLHSWINGDESALTDRTRSQTNMRLDSKAMRKVEVGQDLAVVVSGGRIGSGMITDLMGRMLIKNN